MSLRTRNPSGPLLALTTSSLSVADEPNPSSSTRLPGHHFSRPPTPLPACSLPSSEGGNSIEGGDEDRLAVARALQSKWLSAAARLSSSIPSGRLELALVCDIDPRHNRALEIAMAITTPLRLLPPLRDCHIRLSKTPNRQLQQVAQDSVLRACGIALPSSKPSLLSTLTTLPRELRLRILEYTDLIVPSRQVTWSRQDHGYITSSVEPSTSPDHLYRSQFFHCWYNEGPGPFIGCFCRRRHSAFSFKCKCWAPPGPTLFLICRTLYQDAQFVFFSGNCFVIHDYRTCPPWEMPCIGGQTWEENRIPRRDYPNERLAVSQFLREVIPTHCLAYLRFLEVVFPPYPPSGWPQAGHPAMDDWWATVDWLQDKVNLPALTLRLVGAGANEVTPDAYTATITVSEGDTIMKAHMALLRPLTHLAHNGLARFYANFIYPWLWTEESQVRNYKSDWTEIENRKIKESAERYVMGDRYEGLYASNKKEPERSSWEYSYY
ncbi:predicted protein [Chaetomium globosum CBS 148.51]|uniref:F-box domain-containing protein n=1 Tax=Chaetomium globosum (strain ATCC 6205 / CBS 148.51 / DSM 1962 / NBRC 6347 / NRRL 1970) TaxID=306901 RepID=Q2H347_CHAGB|nr:uncharacterized protein CHGG_03799 [Chaetomium globosum CBS 148.51]EAQ87180.1 predicted protein [Chaetomium globosum CBS 148.51]